MLFKSLQEDFDYTNLLKEASNSVELLLGDRNHADAMNYICELYLSEETMKKIRITFVPNCCHMIMIESPKELAEILNNIMDDVSMNIKDREEKRAY